MACIVIDACSAKEYPDRSNAKRYKLFLKRHFSTICKYGFPGIQATNIRIKVNVPDSNLIPDENGYVDMEQIIYHVLRCGLVHDCSIEKTIRFLYKGIIINHNKNRANLH